MSAKLVIVESPKKAKTIKEYLGQGYEVIASNGHVRDLPKSSLGVDVEQDFKPKYIATKGKSDLLKKLKSAAKSAETVYLATDPDREGEAISWHLANLLGLDLKTVDRVTFSEITQSGVEQGMAAPRRIDLKLVDAQQTRRVLDRLVGYKMSPFLWKKVKAGLSAGRVQSVVVRLIVDREKQIKAFVPEESWSVDAMLAKKKSKKAFAAHLIQYDGQKVHLKTKAQADAILADLATAQYQVQEVKTGKRTKNPLPPFITSTLQQEASKRLGFVSKKTMMLAQELYEGVTLADGSTMGLITYMRTDSLRLSEEAISAARGYILEVHGSKFLPRKPNHYANRNKAQDAHEAIRPSTPSLTPAALKDSLTRDQYRLYKLIWERFMASQMTPALYDTLSADIKADKAIFRAAGQTLVFAGFLTLYDDKTDEDNETVPMLEKDELLDLRELKGNQHFTQPPPRFTEASLIKALEEYGIGRPSTYAPIIATVLARNYVQREGKVFVPTALGEVTTQQIQTYFADIVDVEFTAEMENRLDEVEQGKRSYLEVISQFYQGFEPQLEKAMATVGDEKIALPVEESDVVCEKCGRKMVYKNGRFGRFLACPGFPACRNTKSITQTMPGSCPICGGAIQSRRSKKGKQFFCCEHLPGCSFMSWDAPTDQVCPKCGKTLFHKKGRNAKLVCATEGCFYEQPLPKE